MRAFKQALEHGSKDLSLTLKATRYLMLINGISEEDIRNFPLEEINYFTTFESIYRENNNKEIAYWISKSIVGGK